MYIAEHNAQISALRSKLAVTEEALAEQQSLSQNLSETLNATTAELAKVSQAKKEFEEKAQREAHMLNVRCQFTIRLSLIFNR